MEEKYGQEREGLEHGTEIDNQEESDSSDEEEDDDGLLASGTLDEEYLATLRAIKERDPRVYDRSTKFYTSTDDTAGAQSKVTVNKEAPVFLRDYHRNNLFNAHEQQELENKALSYENEQRQLKATLVKQMHEAAEDGTNGKTFDTSENEEDMFMVRRSVDAPERPETISISDVAQADKDPDRFLARFMTARAWVPNEAVRFHPFESDDDEDDRKAEEFEEAYNMRFENPGIANEKITTHARDIAVKYSARHEPKSRRKRAREVETSHKNEARAGQIEERKMLRKLRLEEAEQKLDKIRDAVGTESINVNLEDWSKFLTQDWDTATWESEMQQRFGETYYSTKDHAVDGKANDDKMVKPKWSSDIDITDIVPGFRAEQETIVSLSDGNDDSGRDCGLEQLDKRNNEKRKRNDREQRRKLRELVEEKVDLEVALEGRSTNGSKMFRYRETSPLSYGLTPHDILSSTDIQLNQFAGLKKYATFRDPQKRKKDARRLGKKARLRQWRTDTFGSEQILPRTLQDIMMDAQASRARDKKDPVNAVSSGGREKPTYQGSRKKGTRKKEQT